jgi:hypothetical protein
VGDPVGSYPIFNSTSLSTGFTADSGYNTLPSTPATSLISVIYITYGSNGYFVAAGAYVSSVDRCALLFLKDGATSWIVVYDGGKNYSLMGLSYDGTNFRFGQWDNSSTLRIYYCSAATLLGYVATTNTNTIFNNLLYTFISDATVSRLNFINATYYINNTYYAVFYNTNTTPAYVVYVSPTGTLNSYTVATNIVVPYNTSTVLTGDGRNLYVNTSSILKFSDGMSSITGIYTSSFSGSIPSTIAGLGSYGYISSLNVSFTTFATSTLTIYGNTIITNQVLTPYLTPTSMRIKTIAYGNGIFVIGDNAGRIYKSSNGYTFGPSLFQAQYGLEVNSIAYGNGYWVIGIQSGNATTSIVTSTDLVNFTTQTNNHTNVYCILYANSIWVAAGQSGVQYTGNNPTTGWTASSGLTTLCYSIAYGNSTWVAGGGPGSVYIASGGTPATFSATGTPTFGNIYSIIYVPGYFIVAGQDATNKSKLMIYNTSTSSWTQPTLTPTLSNFFLTGLSSDGVSIRFNHGNSGANASYLYSFPISSLSNTTIPLTLLYTQSGNSGLDRYCGTFYLNKYYYLIIQVAILPSATLIISNDGINYNTYINIASYYSTILTGDGSNLFVNTSSITSLTPKSLFYGVKGYLSSSGFYTSFLWPGTMNATRSYTDPGNLFSIPPYPDSSPGYYTVQNNGMIQNVYSYLGGGSTDASNNTSTYVSLLRNNVDTPFLLGYGNGCNGGLSSPNLNYNVNKGDLLSVRLSLSSVGAGFVLTNPFSNTANNLTFQINMY